MCGFSQLKQAEPQSGACGTKRKYTTLFTVQEVIDNLVDYAE